MSSVNRWSGLDGAADEPQSSEVDEMARDTTRTARRVGSAAAGFVAGVRRVDASRERERAVRVRAVADAADRFFAAHPDRGDRVQARRDADAVDIAMSRDTDERIGQYAAWYREWNAAQDRRGAVDRRRSR
ncbi:hypothetical protein [Nocardia wallacei]|uniref:Uncharacterized protein n=1 Tax=Nocardia wallacei TaxID=480035 RepID=A0A7G1KDR5_9NOCA|nr:hypothetical protein [Nocardia wallacei]BCK53021.1 hypothetical protein NWFMUON74_07930 [Nocardia wallacei]